MAEWDREGKTTVLAGGYFVLCEFILPDIERRRVKVIFVMECASFDFFTSTPQKKPQLIQSS